MINKICSTENEDLSPKLAIDLHWASPHTQTTLGKDVTKHFCYVFSWSWVWKSWHSRHEDVLSCKLTSLLTESAGNIDGSNYWCQSASMECAGKWPRWTERFSLSTKMLWTFTLFPRSPEYPFSGACLCIFSSSLIASLFSTWKLLTSKSLHF